MTLQLSYFFQRAQVDERRIYCPIACTPVRVLFASDIHYSRMFPDRALEALLEQVASLSPDLILWGGDYAETPAYQKGFFEAVRRLAPPLGMMGVPGNNDSRCFAGDAAALSAQMRAGGVWPLVNCSRDILLPGGRLRVGGLDEISWGRPSAAALFPEPQENDFTVLLAHYPGALFQAARLLRPGLALGGHTHGGQICIGGLNPYKMGFEWQEGGREVASRASGHWEENGTQYTISAGVGVSRVPLRVGVPPQIHLLTLDARR